jgi:hypothetical protein
MPPLSHVSAAVPADPEYNICYMSPLSHVSAAAPADPEFNICYMSPLSHVSAAVPADPEYNISRAQLHHHLPHAHQHPRPVHEEEVEEHPYYRQDNKSVQTSLPVIFLKQVLRWMLGTLLIYLWRRSCTYKMIYAYNEHNALLAFRE